MTTRVPVGKRVKSIWLKGSEDFAAAGSIDEIITSHIWEQDITIIGIEIHVDWGVHDAHLNADGEFQSQVCVTPQSNGNLPGVLARVHQTCCWTAAILAGLPFAQHTVMFPEGHGKEFDEGEGLNIHVFATTTSLVAVTFSARAIIFYVER